MDSMVRYLVRVWLCSRQSQHRSVVHPESSDKMVAASVTGIQLSGHAWYEQNASQHTRVILTLHVFGVFDRRVAVRAADRVAVQCSTRITVFVSGRGDRSSEWSKRVTLL